MTPAPRGRGRPGLRGHADRRPAARLHGAARPSQAIAALHGRLDRVEEVIERAGLGPLVRARKVQACSGGEQQRLQVRPGAGPRPRRDPARRADDRHGRRLPGRRSGTPCAPTPPTGRTIVFATHYLAEADAFADRTVLMARGRIVEDGPTADVRAAFGGRTVSFRPPADVVRPRRDRPGLARRRVRQALAPLGVDDVEVASASLEAAFLALTGDVPRPPSHATRASRPREPCDDHHDHHPAPTPDRRTAGPGPSPTPRLDLRRQLRDRLGMFFTVGLPAFMFFVFGLGSDEPVGSANVAMYVMVSMAAYGAVTATTAVAGAAATEQTMGWGRQLALTPMPSAGVRGDQDRGRDDRRRRPDRADLRDRRGHRLARQPRRLAGSAAVIVWVVLGGVRGLRAGGHACSSAARTPSAIASGLIVIMAFLGNVFTPMERADPRHRSLHPALRVRRAGPLPAHRRLAPDRRRHDPLWLPIANVITWTVIFAALAVWGAASRAGAGVSAPPTAVRAPARSPWERWGVGRSPRSGWSSSSTRSSRPSRPTSLGP